MTEQLLELALYVIVLGAAAVGMITALRKAPLVSGWNERGIKPWACDLCMTFWTTLVLAGADNVAGPVEPRWAFWAWMGAFALAYSWLSRLTPMPTDSFDPGIPMEPEPPTLSPDVPGAEGE